VEVVDLAHRASTPREAWCCSRSGLAESRCGRFGLFGLVLAPLTS
jgi:hypothetical protein